jgi:homoserine dehydrogenase
MSKPRVINIGFCGLGTVGQGVWKHLSASRVQLEGRLGARLELYRVAVRHPAKARGVAIPAARLTTDALAVATDPAVHIVCELIGGTTVAREVTLAALAKGKVVVSANKALLCGYGAEIFKAARKGG